MKSRLQDNIHRRAFKSVARGAIVLLAVGIASAPSILANSKPKKTFSGVTSVVADDARGLIYLSNDEGLWVVQAKQQKAEADSKYLSADVN